MAFVTNLQISHNTLDRFKNAALRNANIQNRPVTTRLKNLAYVFLIVTTNTIYFALFMKVINNENLQ